jgi:hypothetical protein
MVSRGRLRHCMLSKLKFKVAVDDIDGQTTRNLSPTEPGYGGFHRLSLQGPVPLMFKPSKLCEVQLQVFMPSFCAHQSDKGPGASSNVPGEVRSEI